MRKIYLVLALLQATAVACGPDGGPMVTPDGGLPDGALPDGALPDGGTPDGSTSTFFPPPRVTACPGDSLPAPTEGRCTVTPGSEAKLITADILQEGEVLHGGQILVSAAGLIECVGCDCAANAAGATQVVCPDVVVSPGLINAHDHVTFASAKPYAADNAFTVERYEHRHDWREGIEGHRRVSAGGGTSSTEQMQWLELRQLMSGTTSIFGSGGADGLLRNLDSNRLEGLDAQQAEYQTFPLGDSSGTKLVGECTYAFRDSAANIMQHHAYVPHLAEGIDGAARNEFRCIREGERDLITPRTAIIHGVGLLPSDIAELSAEDVELIWSPRSNITLYGDTARITEYARQGVPIGLGTDWVRSGSMNLLRELNCADTFNQNYLDNFFPDEQLWLMATANNAKAFNLDDKIGAIEMGNVADLAFYDASMHRDHRAVLNAGPEDVVLVMRGGLPMYGDAALVESLRTGCEPLTTAAFTDVCGSAKRICLQGVQCRPSSDAPFAACTVAILAGRSSSEYPLFFCGEPTSEPSCLPARTSMGGMYADAMDMGSNYYAGMSSEMDEDGDGILNEMDSCRSVFNPIRPMDGGHQADHDSDGIGDACDVCPLGGDATPATCNTVDPNDRDGDGIMTANDNCPEIANQDQMDRDGDAKGDACDACPMLANPGNAACPASVYAIRRGMIPASALVAVPSLVVTAVGTDHFYAQQIEGSAGFDGVDFSGITVYPTSMPTVHRGDEVTVTGVVADRFTLSVLQEATVTMTGTGRTVAPVVVTPAEIATGGARAEALESVFVRAENLTVTTAPDMFNEFIVTGNLRIDDTLYRISPAPVVNEVFSYIQGPLSFAFSNTKIYPRELGDIGVSTLRVSMNPIAIATGAMVNLTVALPRAAMSGDELGVVVSPATLITVGAHPVTVGERVVTIPMTAAAAAGTGMVTLTFDGMMLTIPASVVDVPQMIFTEYIEPNIGNHKAIEFQNIGANPIDLSTCELVRYTNGATMGSSVRLSGTLASRGIYSVCNTATDASAMCSLRNDVMVHNGDDAFALICAGTVVDRFGQVGTDPGMAWMSGGVSSMDQVLRRACTVTMGQTNAMASFDIAAEGWMGTAFNMSMVPVNLTGLGNRSECL